MVRAKLLKLFLQIVLLTLLATLALIFLVPSEVLAWLAMLIALSSALITLYYTNKVLFYLALVLIVAFGVLAVLSGDPQLFVRRISNELMRYLI